MVIGAPGQHMFAKKDQLNSNVVKMSFELCDTKELMSQHFWSGIVDLAV